MPGEGTGSKVLLAVESCHSVQTHWFPLCLQSHFHHVGFFVTLWTVARQAPLSMGFSRQEYWSGLSFPSPGDLPNSGIKPRLLSLLCWQACFLPLVPSGGEGDGTQLQYSCLENPVDRGAWWAAVHGVSKSQHDWATLFSLFTFMHWRMKCQPTPVFLPGEPQGGGAWWAAVYGVAQSWTWLKQLSSSSSAVWEALTSAVAVSNPKCILDQTYSCWIELNAFKVEFCEERKASLKSKIFW